VLRSCGEVEGASRFRGGTDPYDRGVSIDEVPHRPTWQRWLPVGLTAVFLVVAGAGGLAGLTHQPGSSNSAPRAGSASELDVVESRAAERVTLNQAQSRLDGRARQVLRGAIAATATVPFVRYSLDLVSSADPSPSDLAAGAFSTSAVIRYQLPNDPVTVRRTVAARFERGPSGWRLAHLGTDGRDLWEHEAVAVATTGRTMVIGSSRYAARLGSLADQVDSARRQVGRFWTADWSGRVVVIFPSKARTMDQLIGSGSASSLPAATTWTRGPTGAVVRVTVNPDVFLALPFIAQQIVLRHEITHVAQDAGRAGRAPIWLTEGLAEYVGYRGTGIARSIVAGGLLDRVRSNRAPHSLPRDRHFAFDLSPRHRALVYEAGWAACQLVVDRYGESRLIPFYRAVLRAGGSKEQRVNQAAEQVLGINANTFVKQWRAWLVDAA
jgi:hypothetical protein